MNASWYSALRWGAICGGVVGLIEAASYWAALRAPVAQMMAPQAGGLGAFEWLGLIQLALEWLAAMVAGWLAGRETGERNFGLVAGLISGAVVAVISIIYQVMAPPPLELITGPDGSVDQVGGIISATFTSLWMGGLGGWLAAWLATRGRTSPPA